MTITSEMGDALGVNIESELRGLSYKVRYLFDVCLAHGYLCVPTHALLIVL